MDDEVVADSFFQLFSYLRFSQHVFAERAQSLSVSLDKPDFAIDLLALVLSWAGGLVITSSGVWHQWSVDIYRIVSGARSFWL